MSQRFTQYELSAEWSQEAYRQLVDLAARRGGFCILVADRFANAQCKTWLDENALSLDRTFQTTRWPGTRVFSQDEAVALYKFRVTPSLLKSLKQTARTVFGWLGPSLPEDLAFLRVDGTPWFISTAHEGAAYFHLAPCELEEVAAAFPGYSLVQHGDVEAHSY